MSSAILTMTSVRREIAIPHPSSARSENVGFQFHPLRQFLRIILQFQRVNALHNPHSARLGFSTSEFGRLSLDTDEVCMEHPGLLPEGDRRRSLVQAHLVNCLGGVDVPERPGRHFHENRGRDQRKSKAFIVDDRMIVEELGRLAYQPGLSLA